MSKETDGQPGDHGEEGCDSERWCDDRVRFSCSA
jgi:hypothetical protein